MDLNKDKKVSPQRSSASSPFHSPSSSDFRSREGRGGVGPPPPSPHPHLAMIIGPSSPRSSQVDFEEFWAGSKLIKDALAGKSGEELEELLARLRTCQL